MYENMDYYNPRYTQIGMSIGVIKSHSYASWQQVINKDNSAQKFFLNME
mgnify:FL=1